MSALELWAQAMLTVLVVTGVLWWGGGALLGACLPRGKVGWRIRAGLAVVGALALMLLHWVAWWVVVDLGGAGPRVRRALPAGGTAANVTAALIAVISVTRRVVQRRRRRGGPAGPHAE